jgi:CheY-like chemotaxis protein
MKGNPAMLGGPFTSKPTWWKTSGCSATSAILFSAVPHGRNREDEQDGQVQFSSVKQAALKRHGVRFEKESSRLIGGTRTIASFPTESVKPMSSSLRVASADDDRSLCDVLQQMLRNLGHEVVAIAESAESLIRQCFIALPDVVITGDLLPGMCGADAAAAIYKSRPIPIILVSGNCDRDLVVNAEQKDVFMYLVKPICQEHLETALEGCRRQDLRTPSGNNEDDENNALVGCYRESSGSASDGDHIRSPLSAGVSSASLRFGSGASRHSDAQISQKVPAKRTLDTT